MKADILVVSDNYLIESFIVIINFLLLAHAAANPGRIDNLAIPPYSILLPDIFHTFVDIDTYFQLLSNTDPRHHNFRFGRITEKL